MKLSKQYKAEHYDEVVAEREKLSLAVYDLVNEKFSKPVKVRAKEYGSRGSIFQGDYVTVKVSWRAMPLFLVEWYNDLHERTNVNVWTESELEDMSRNTFCTANRMLRDAFCLAKKEHYPKAS